MVSSERANRVLQVAGALASLVALAAGFASASPLSRIVLVPAGFVAIGLVVLLYMRAVRDGTLQRDNREGMIDRSREFILATKSTLVAFGGDLSWAADYADDFRKLVQSGKRVFVISDAFDAPKTKENMRCLVSEGVIVVSGSSAVRIRGFLIDATDIESSLFLLSDRVPGSHRHYFSKIYDPRRDPVVLSLVSNHARGAGVL